MAVFNEPTQWEHPLGNNADTSTLPDNAAATAGIASLQKLFQIINATPLEAGGIAPDREDVNALFKYLGDQIFYTQNGGIPSYNAAYDYIPGRVVLYTDNNLYKCIQANGASSTVVAPTDSTYWSQIPTYADLVDPVPTGVVLPFGGSTVPEGFLLCNGAAISRTTYAKLFAAIGTLYGAGDGATTFNLPDMRDRFAEGAGTYSVGTAVEAGLPNITGILYLVTGSNDCTGSFYFTSSTNSRISASVVANANNVIGFSASKSTSIYGNSTTVQPSSLVLNYVIKY
jgi:microcystin-dependent protein